MKIFRHHKKGTKNFPTSIFVKSQKKKTLDSKKFSGNIKLSGNGVVLKTGAVPLTKIEN